MVFQKLDGKTVLDYVLENARAAVPPSVATSNPVAAASPLAASASSTNPSHEPPTRTPNTR